MENIFKHPDLQARKWLLQDLLMLTYASLQFVRTSADSEDCGIFQLEAHQLLEDWRENSRPTAPAWQEGESLQCVSGVFPRGHQVRKAVLRRREPTRKSEVTRSQQVMSWSFFFFWLRLAVKNTSRFSNFLWTLRQTSGTGQSKSPVTGPAWSSRISGADERQWLTQFLKPRWPPTVQDFKINVSVKYLYSMYLLNYWSIDTTKMSGKSTKHCKLCFQSRITKKKKNPAM